MNIFHGHEKKFHLIRCW